MCNMSHNVNNIFYNYLEGKGSIKRKQLNAINALFAGQTNVNAMCYMLEYLILNIKLIILLHTLFPQKYKHGD